MIQLQIISIILLLAASLVESSLVTESRLFLIPAGGFALAAVLSSVALGFTLADRWS